MQDKKQRLRRKADKLWYLKYVKEVCEVCGASNCLQVHHFYYKGSFSHLRYNSDNGITLCKGCHFVLHHQDPKKIEDIIRKNRGGLWETRLKKEAYNRPTSSYLTVAYYENIINALQET